MESSDIEFFQRFILPRTIPLNKKGSYVTTLKLARTSSGSRSRYRYHQSIYAPDSIVVNVARQQGSYETTVAITGISVSRSFCYCEIRNAALHEPPRYLADSNMFSRSYGKGNVV